MSNLPAARQPDLFNAPASGPGVAFTYGGVSVRFNDARLVSLTQMWEAAGRPENKDPRQWRKQPQAKSFIDHMARTLDVAKSHIVSAAKGGRGGGGETWAHWQVAMAYAKYLSHDFHQFVNEAFREWAEEKADPALKMKRAVSGYQARGKADTWIVERKEGIVTRKALVSTMADHNCRRKGDDNPFAEATRAISLAVLGKTPREIKADRGLPASARTRDNLDEYELVRIRFAESESKRLMQVEAADGNGECVECCRRAARATRVAIEAMAPKSADHRPA